jgi:hypothetical protein
MNKHYRDCVGICKDAGLTVLGIERRGHHLSVKCEEGFIICPGTPSDHRWRLNLRATARRFGR